jgi:glucosyl-dolichyl phosphate glucuronosyltransferase
MDARERDVAAAPHAEPTEGDLQLCVGMATRSGGDEARLAVESVAGQLAAGDELLIVYTGEDASALQRLEETMAAIAPSVQVLAKYRSGISEARNVILTTARSRFICFLDDDETVHPGWVDGYRRVWASAPERLAVVGGPMLPVWNGGRPPWLHDHLTGVVSVLDLGDERLVLGRELGDPPRLRFAWGGNMSMRKSAIIEAGGFDPDRGTRPEEPDARGEEEELQERLVACGLEVWYEPSVRVWHHIRRERLTVDYFRRVMRLHAREDAKEPHALRRGLTRVLRSSGRFFLGVVRLNSSEQVVARLGVSYGLALVGGALRAHAGRGRP